MVRKILLSSGSNLGQSATLLDFALQELRNKSAYKIGQISKVYRTQAWGGVANRDFLNQIILLETTQNLEDLLKDLQHIETLAGRNRSSESRWGNRYLDLDILLADDLVYYSKTLIIPHPYLHIRTFLLQILVDMGLGNWIHPLLKRNIHEILQQLSNFTA